jgi:SAM-dependent methyltransferase
MTGTFIPQEEWDANYRVASLQVAAEGDPLRRWITRHASGRPGACLELGCFPGRFLAVLGELGWELNGVDLTPRVEVDLPAWLEARGHRVGTFSRTDAFLLEPRRRYDLVCSFGLIEHFEDWEALLRAHARLVAPGGLLLVSAPNFRGGLQGVVHRLLDQENLRKHNVASMDPARWRSIAVEEGLEVLEAGGLGRFECWFGPQRRGWAARKAAKLLSRSGGWLGRLLPADDLRFAPHCAIAARRP